METATYLCRGPGPGVRVDMCTCTYPYSAYRFLPPQETHLYSRRQCSPCLLPLRSSSMSPLFSQFPLPYSPGHHLHCCSPTQEPRCPGPQTITLSLPDSIQAPSTLPISSPVSVPNLTYVHQHPHTESARALIERNIQVDT